MYREIIRPDSQHHMIHIPREYWGQNAEVLVLPFESESQPAQPHKDIHKLLEIGTHDIEKIKVRDWPIETLS